MATRSKSQKQEEPRPTTSQASPNVSSNSPNGELAKATRLSRLDEKNTLIGLNNRLAAIIERNHQLELENSQLTFQVESAEETLKITTKTINESIGKETNEIRKQLLDSQNEKAKALLKAEEFKKQLDEANAKLQKSKNELAEIRKQANSFKEEAAATKLELEKQRFENAQLSAQAKALEGDVKKLGDENGKLKKESEKVNLQNAELRNELKSKSSELAQKIDFHQTEVTALRTFNQKKIEEVGERLGKDYETNLQKVIKSLRTECEKQIGANKLEQENLFKIKELDLVKQKDQLAESLRLKSSEFLIMEKTLHSTKGKINSLEKEKEFLLSQIKGLEEGLKQEEQGNGARMKEFENQLKQLQDEKTQVINDYQDLMETKVALDNEIATYRKLLEGEEERLNLSMEARRTSRKRSWNAK